MAFASGHSGNPQGRPQGAGDQTKRIRKLISAHALQLAETLLAQALKGDRDAAIALLTFYGQTAPQ